MRLPAPGRKLSRRWTFSPLAVVAIRVSLKRRKTQTLLEHPPTPPPRCVCCEGMTHARLVGVRSCFFREGEPCADPPALVCERSLEGESEQPRESGGMDAGANARRSSIGLARAHHHPGAVPSASLCRLRVGSCLVAGFFRRWPLWRFVSHRSGEKLERSSSTRRPLRLVV